MKLIASFLVLLIGLSVQAQTAFINSGKVVFTNSGATVFQVPASGGGGVVATDNFTRASSGSLGPSYTVYGSYGMQISANEAVGAASSVVSSDAWTANTFHNDQYSIVTCGNFAGGSAYVRAYARINGSASTLNAYDVTSNGTSWYIEKQVNGSGTTLATGSATIALGDTIEITVVGTTISAYHNGSLLGTATDSTFSSGYAGIGCYDIAIATYLTVGNVD